MAAQSNGRTAKLESIGRPVHILFRVRIAHSGHFLRRTIACAEGRTVGSTVANKAFFVGRHSIAKFILGVESKRIQLGDRKCVADPCERLFQDHPDCRLSQTGNPKLG